ncbi:CD226 antigen isoform X2 [Octodon degus]|uniref:CD226 antigen isoform X2 n=1 Tax=Octodon degus TaxID=10160 RepID=A0A6P6DT44_OCTDE|nr:CD226 antigen isoform X2 [Octodon degus]
MDFLALLLAILQVYLALCEETFFDTTVRLAENMTLECVYPLMGNLTQAEWLKTMGEEKESMAVFNPKFGLAIKKPYENRVHFLNSTMTGNDMSLSFTNASEADVGTYTCLLHAFPLGSWTKTVQVVQSDSFEIELRNHDHRILSPGSVTLTYELQMNQSAQEVMWEKIQPHQIDLLMHCNLSGGKSYSKYRKQIVTNCTQGIRSSFIIIPNATYSDSGLYRCQFVASTGENETFLMSLTITDGKTDSQNTIAVAVGTVLFLFVVIIVIIIVTFCNRRRRRLKNIPDKSSSGAQSKVSSLGSQQLQEAHLSQPTCR